MQCIDYPILFFLVVKYRTRDVANYYSAQKKEHVEQKCRSNFAKLTRLVGKVFGKSSELNMKLRHGKQSSRALTHFCPPFQHLLFERLTSLGQQMLERWEKIG